MKVACKALALALFFVLGGCILLSLSPLAAGSSGFQIDLFCQYGGRGHDVPCPVAIVVGDRIILFAYVTYDNTPVKDVLVAFQVNNPQGSPLLIAVEPTNASGYATTQFTMSENDYSTFPSWWNSTATTSPAQNSVSDSMPFEVIPRLLVGGISIPVTISTAHAPTWTILVEILIAPALIIFAKIRKRAIIIGSR